MIDPQAPADAVAEAMAALKSEVLDVNSSNVTVYRYICISLYIRVSIQIWGNILDIHVYICNVCIRMYIYRHTYIVDVVLYVVFQCLI